ncbi:MAG: hypothetical protein MI919_08855 [Holophagales bacterium]|nr:hypothetical protein [Holophagales bacterium]
MGGTHRTRKPPLHRPQVAWLAGLLWLSAAASVPADSELRQAAQLDDEVAHIVESCRVIFAEVWEETGGFEGYDGAMEEADELGLDLAALQDRAGEMLARGVDDATRDALLDFLRSDAGRKFTWSGRALASRDGRRDLLRHGRGFHANLPPERIVELEAVDRATHDGAIARAIVVDLVDLVDRAAVRIESLTGEPAEWVDPKAEVSARLKDFVTRRVIVRLSYRLSRMDGGELGRLLDWAESPAGQSFHAARREALLGVATEVTERFAEAQKASIDEALWEYRRENDEHDEREHDEEGN